ncbi:Gfo/Idh/MocA family oxidoreductase [Streptomyces sp. TRM 70361]|uniref:Gfo/Idh/MocA family oxidoreductase n=1 Tax=Streptomyces sp. TRM 70361 TaxID=3116553 RepID=UPI002E7BD14B|nr:Gfo/Idh/MocA family oxidoreductase [Streptomyces sp. TRM 70361]MEE1937913.1 Gfo/Idh/MocA family oxidoreductase [Streptomyces sp. TRM 70361]
MDTTSRPLRVGLIGYGLAGAVFHAPLIAATDGLVLDTVVTSDPERQRQARAEHGENLRTAADSRELFDRAGELDLVVVASPNRTHVELATRALEADLAVVVDKPLAATAAEAEALAGLAERRGLLLSVFQNRRWDADFRTLRRLLEQGELGEVWRFESRFERWRPALKGGWRESGDPAEAGGLLYDLGSHLVDQAIVLFGPVESVYAESDARRPGSETDDDTFLALRHAGGVRSHLWVSATAARLGPRLRVLGSRAAYVKHGLDPQEDALRAGARPVAGARWGVEPEAAWGVLGAGDETRPVPSLDGDYPAYYAAVAAALRDGTAPPVTAREAADALRVLEAARVSAAEGRTVRLTAADRDPASGRS